MSTVKVGDVVTWEDVPIGALAWSDGYAVRLARGGYWAALGARGEGRMWESWEEMVGIGEAWNWLSEAGSDATIIALGLTGQETADDLRALAEVFEVRECLQVLVVDQTYGIGMGPKDEEHVFLVAWGDPYGHLEIDEALDLVAANLHRAGWRPDMTAEDAARLLAEVQS